MTDYEPGRIYSGIVLDKRIYHLYTGDLWVTAHPGGYKTTPHAPKDVRGPLVVLDLSRCDVPWVISQLVENTDDTYLADIAAQIEAQTTPPLQVGWHETDGTDRPLWWNGADWECFPGDGALRDRGACRSTLYLGKGTHA